MADRPSLFTLTHFDVQPPPADVMRAWDEACMIAYNLGRKPVVNFPIGLASERITALIDQATGEAIPVNWLPAERFPSRLPAQYFNPDLILPEVPPVADLDIAAFLRARLDERERAGETLRGDYWIESMEDGIGDALQLVADSDAVLADVAAKRQIIERHSDTEGGGMGWGSPEGGYGSYPHACSTCGTADEYAVAWPCETLRLLALPYAGHPDYQEGWKL